MWHAPPVRSPLAPLDSALLAQQDGKLDNIIIESSVHVVVGSLVLLSLAACTFWLVRRAMAGETVDSTGKALIGVTQAVLTVQILLGIKLLDQGQGWNQLYIHYIGGLVPMGAFVVGGWWIRGETPKQTRILAGLVALGLLSAVMAFTIGQSYANR